MCMCELLEHLSYFNKTDMKRTHGLLHTVMHLLEIVVMEE